MTAPDDVHVAVPVTYQCRHDAGDYAGNWYSIPIYELRRQCTGYEFYVCRPSYEYIYEKTETSF